jgi:hypothetical protein
MLLWNVEPLQRIELWFPAYETGVLPLNEGGTLKLAEGRGIEPQSFGSKWLATTGGVPRPHYLPWSLRRESNPRGQPYEDRLAPWLGAMVAAQGCAPCVSRRGMNPTASDGISCYNLVIRKSRLFKGK